VVERADPGRTGVRAGRVVGVLTALLAVSSLVQARGSYQQAVETITGLFGVDLGLPVTVLFWANVVLAAVARYTLCYAVGSLVGVVYDWLDDDSLVPVAAMIAVIGVVDGALAGLDTLSPLYATAYFLAWLPYLPVFAWLRDPDAGDDRSGPRRLGDSRD
jgi:hypothetical protein